MLAFDSIKIKKNLSYIADAQLSITNWIQAFLKTDLDSLAPAFGHFNDIGNIGEELKSEVKKWIDVLGPDISRDIPHGIYDFAYHFSVIKPEIIALVEAIKRNKYNNEGDAIKRELIQLLTMLHVRAIDQKFGIEQFSKLFNVFYKNMSFRIRKLIANSNPPVNGMQITVDQREKPSLDRFDKAAAGIVNYLFEIYSMWDALIQKIVQDIQLLKRPDADISVIKDLQTLNQAEENWKELEQVVRV